MLSVDQHSDIVARIYASALGDTPWTATLAHLANAFRSTAALVQISDPTFTQLRVENHGHSREFTERFYASDTYARDPRVAYYHRIKPGTVYYDHALYDMEEMERDPFCRESCNILGVKYQLGAVMTLSDATIGAITVLQTDREGHASAGAIAA